MLRFFICLFLPGLLSTPLLAQTKSSTGSGNWNTAGTWSPNGVPTSTDNVLINNGHTITFNTNGACNSMTVGSGGGANAIFQFSGATARTFSVQSLLVVNSNGFIQVLNTSNTTHSLSLNGDLTNDGSFDMNRDGNSRCRVVFTRNGNQTVSGAGSVNDYFQLVLNKGSSSANTVDITSNGFSVPTNFLTLINGTFKLSTVNAITVTPFTNAASIPATCGIWLNSPTAVMSCGNDLTLSGLLRVSNGLFNLGNANNEDLIASSGTLDVSGGELNIAGKLNASAAPIQFQQSGGIIRVANSQSGSNSIAPFEISSTGSGFNMSGGSIELVREGGNGTQNLGFVNTGSSSGSVTGGTLQVGNASTPTGQTFLINSSFPIPNLVLNSSNATAQLITNSLQVNGSVFLNSGTLNDNNLSLALSGNWSNNGGSYANTNGTVIFNSTSSSQFLFRSGGETFNHLGFTGSGLKQFAAPVTAKSFSILSGSNVDVSTSNHLLTLTGNFVNNGSFVSRSGTVAVSGSTLQNIGGTSLTDFFDLSLNNSVGAQLTGSVNLNNKLSISNGTFNTNGQAFTLISNSAGTARIGQISGTGNVIGHLTVQRFAPGGSTGWAFLGTPISSALSLQDWDDDIFISCPGCPDGSAAGFNSVYTYNEAASGTVDDAASYVALSGTGDPISADKGYWVYLGNAQTSTGDITLDVTGSVRKFNQSIPLSFTNFGSSADDGWNLIHNPFPSPISWTAFRGSTPNLDNAYYVYNADLNGGTGGYASFVNGVSSPAAGSGGIDDNIPMSQGFYVHCTAATTLSAGENVKTDANPVFLKSQSADTTSSLHPTLRLQLSDSMVKDECVVYYNAGSGATFNSQFDALKLPGTDPTAPSMALYDNSLNLQIKGIPAVNGSYSVELLVKTGHSGLYTIAADLQHLPGGLCLSLMDRYTNTLHDLKNGPAQFWLYDSTSWARFVLLLERHPLTVLMASSPPDCSSPDGGQIWAIPQQTGPWEFTWKDSNGQVLQQHLQTFPADTLQHLSGGTYSLEVVALSGCRDYKASLFLQGVSVPIADFYSTDSLLAGNYFQPSNLSQNALLFNWDLGDGSALSNLYEPSHFYAKPGTYRVTLYTESQSACIDSLTKELVVFGEPAAIIERDVNQQAVIQNLGDKTFHIIFNGNTEKLSTVLLDATGRQLVMQPLEVQHNQITLDLRNLSSGIYYLKFELNKRKGILKLPVFQDY